MRRLLRTLLLAVLLAGLQAPLALGQMEQAEMYEYHYLYSSGSVVFAYVLTDIAYPPYYNHCYYGCNNNCWEEYTSYAEVNLYWDGFWMGGYWASMSDEGVYAWVSTDAWPGEWVLEAKHEIDYLYYLDAYGFGWIEPMMYAHQWVDLTINPEISITGGVLADDNEYWAQTYYVSAELGTPTSFEWSFDYPPGSGNNPHVEFEFPQDALTMTDAHWFANPNERCGAALASTYTITANVGFNGSYLNEDSSLEVRIPWDPGGQTLPPKIEGPVYVDQVEGSWVVVGASLERTAPDPLIFVSTTSQFRHKVEVHEQVHVEQFGADGIWEELYNPADFWAILTELSAETEEDLQDAIAAAKYVFYGVNAAAVTASMETAEAEAYSVSDLEDPKYVYEGNCM